MPLQRLRRSSRSSAPNSTTYPNTPLGAVRSLFFNDGVCWGVVGGAADFVRALDQLAHARMIQVLPRARWHAGAGGRGPRLDCRIDPCPSLHTSLPCTQVGCLADFWAEPLWAGSPRPRSPTSNALSYQVRRRVCVRVCASLTASTAARATPHRGSTGTGVHVAHTCEAPLGCPTSALPAVVRPGPGHHQASGLAPPRPPGLHLRRAGLQREGGAGIRAGEWGCARMRSLRRQCRMTRQSRRAPSRTSTPLQVPIPPVSQFSKWCRTTYGLKRPLSPPSNLVFRAKDYANLTNLIVSAATPLGGRGPTKWHALACARLCLLHLPCSLRTSAIALSCLCS